MAAHEQLRHGRIVTDEHQALFDELNTDAALIQVAYNAAQVIEIAAQAVQRVNDDGIAFPGVLQQLCERRTIRVFARAFIGVEFINLREIADVIVGSDSRASGAAAEQGHHSGVDWCA